VDRPEPDVVNVVIAGLGGQGVLTCSDILAEAAFRAGYDVKKAEVHGMSQRGGSVASDVRFGRRVLSPMVSAGQAHFLVVLEPTQVEPNRHYLAPDGVLITPEAIAVAALPTAKALNIALLGLLSTHLALPGPAWTEAIHAHLPQRLHAMNDLAFAAGRAAAGRELKP
jgi:indolepyruvate ferredoxin oxidoreductase beta subunit